MRTWVRQLAACALVSAASAGRLEWSEIAYPSTKDQHQIRTSPSVKVDGKEASIGYMKLFRSGENYGGKIAGQNMDINGDPVKEFSDAGTKGTKNMVSNSPDFSSILQIEGKLFGVTQYEAPSPGAAQMTEYEQDAATGAIKTVGLKQVDFSSQEGVWVPCAGSVTPWETHLGSEEYPPDGRKYFDMERIEYSMGWPWTHSVYMARYFGHYNNSMVPRAHLESLGYHPYAYGYPWETVVKKDFTEKTTKLYAHGRQSYEMSYVMPDEKTVYSTDDGTNCVFTMFKAKKEKDLKEGTNWCMKMTQTSDAGVSAKDFTANVTWIEMPTPTHDEAKDARLTTTFSDLFDYEACTGDEYAETCASDGFKTVNIGEGCECLKVKSGMEKLAGVFEKRRMAGYLGCTTEFRKWEGITYDPATKKAYTAISSVERGMEDNLDSRDFGSGNHIKVKKEKCGCVMEFDIDDDMKATQARMLTCGKASSDANPVTAGRFDDSCDTGFIANPDNVAIIPGARQLIIGEDTSKHIANLIWIWDFDNQTLTRIGATPMGSETTSPYWYNIGDWSYMMFVVQHPYGARTIETSSSSWSDELAMNPSGKAAWIGLVGPIPNPQPTISADDADESSAPRGAAAFLSVTLLSAVMAFMATFN